MITINAIDLIDEDLRQYVQTLIDKEGGMPLELIAMKKLNEAMRRSVDEHEKKEEPAKVAKKEEPNIKSLGLTPGKEAALENAGIACLEDLCKLTIEELTQIKGLGAKSAEFIDEALWTKHGLRLGVAPEEEAVSADPEEEEEEYDEWEEETEDDEFEEEEDYYDLLTSLPTNQVSSVIKAFNIYQEAWGIEDKEVAKAKSRVFTEKIFVNKDPSTYPKTIQAFIDNLPLSAYQKKKIYELGEAAGETREFIEKELPEAMCGKILNKFTFGEGQKLILELESEMPEDENGLEDLF